MGVTDAEHDALVTEYSALLAKYDEAERKIRHYVITLARLQLRLHSLAEDAESQILPEDLRTE